MKGGALPDNLSDVVTLSAVSDCAAARSLYVSALASGLVVPNDVLTIRDILRLAGYREKVGGDDGELDAAAMHAILISLFVVTREGSLCLPLDVPTLTREFDRFCGAALPVPGDAVFPAALLAVRANALIGGGHPVLCNPSGLSPYPIECADGRRLYLQKYHHHETSLQGMLTALRDSPESPVGGPDPDGARTARIISIVSAGRAGLDLNDEQKMALLLAMRRRFVVISGGPGTGKTRILASMLRAWTLAGASPSEILLTAPTGRAGKRMGESINAALDDAVIDPSEARIREIRQMSGVTIHRAMGFNPGRNDFQFGSGNPLPHRFFVCDEVSMVDVAMMDRFVMAIPPDARVVFLGDRDQLPSVEAGAVLGDIIPRTDAAGNPCDFVPEYSRGILESARLAGLVSVASEVDRAVGGGAGYVQGDGPMRDTVAILKKSYRARGQVFAVAAAVNRRDRHAFDAVRDLPAGHVPVGADWGTPGATCGIIAPPDNPWTAPDPVMLSWIAWLYGVQAAGDPRGGPDHDTLREIRAAFRTISGIVVDQTDPGNHPAASALLESLFESMGRGRILCALRDGPDGVGGVNARISRMVGRGERFFPGCPVMITRNLHRLELYNGDVGVVVTGRDGLLAVFRDGAGWRAFPVVSLGACEPAFAITIHKSQGSEYGNVLIVLPRRPDHPLLTREILYTAMTRSKNNVWFAGTRECLASATARGTSRYSGLDLRS